MPASASRRGTIATAYHRGLTAVLVALAIALLTALSLSPVYAAKPSSPPPTDPQATPTTAPSPSAKPDKPQPTATPAAQPSQPPTDLDPDVAADYAARAEAVIAIARAQVGKPYRVGREGPDIFDCSGLVYRAFTDAGEGNQIGVARMRAAGYMRWFAARGLLTTNIEDVARGDLVIYNNGSHIGIYLGDGRVISALTSGVTVHSLEGITLPVTAFLAVDWSGERGPFVPGALPLPTTNEEAPASLVAPITWTTAPSAEVAAGPEMLGEERVDMRTANSQTFEHEDGSFTTEFFNRPVFYQPADSTEWLPIDLHFREPVEGEDEDGLAIADTSPSTLILRSSTDEAGMLSLGSAGYSFGLDPMGAAPEEIVPTVIEGTYADYQDALGKDVGLRILPRADGVKAFLVFAREPKSNTFTFSTTALGMDGLPLTYTAELDGSVTLRDAALTSYGRIMRPSGIL